MKVRDLMLLMAVIAVLFALFAGICAPVRVCSGVPLPEESALIHGNLLHDEPILHDSGAEPIVIRPYQ